MREALRRLADERLVVERPRQGMFVRRFDGRDLVDIYNMRLAVESSAVRLAVRRRARTGGLRRMIDRMATGARAGNVARVVDAEYAFHEELCSASRNEYLLAAYRTLSAQVRMALTLDNRAYPDLTAVAGEHHEIVATIDAGDEAAAELAIRRHIVAGVAATIVRLGGDPGLRLHPEAT